ncbi:MAG: glycosyltransferase family 2 protein [Streptococcaceae bacterium]|jgi:glycosyltransferase involved in cell wall biosynthesis|nr:glycosyltransferase family 2 protein [Streptococcaceae bacterium]
MKITDTVIIIPAHNEEQVIAQTLKDVSKYFENIVVVNDGSRDNTEKEARKSNAHVLTHAFALGQGGAIQTGIEFALTFKEANYFVTLDADGQHLPTDAVKMREQLIKNDDDIVTGSRFLGSTVNMPKAKKMLLKAATWFSNKTSNSKFTDAHNGLRIFNRHVAQTLNIQENSYQHASEISEKIITNKYKYSEAPVTIVYTDYSIGKGQSMLNAINIGFDVLLRKVVKK